MAAPTVCGVSGLCRALQRVITLSPASVIKPQLPAACYIPQKPAGHREGPGPFGLSRTLLCRPLHTSSSRLGLDQFFDLPENWGESTVKSGAPWTASQLRAKSNLDLHKLWYVLLKEKNMLLTIEQEAKRQKVQMPSPERMKKVERSMKRLDTVVTEREDALRLLQTGQEKGRPGAWRRNVFGKTFWYRCREHPIPWYLNKTYKRKRFYTPLFVDHYTRLSLEKHLRRKAQKKRLEKQRQEKLALMFPKQTTAT